MLCSLYMREDVRWIPSTYPEGFMQLCGIPALRSWNRRALVANWPTRQLNPSALCLGRDTPTHTQEDIILKIIFATLLLLKAISVYVCVF